MPQRKTGSLWPTLLLGVAILGGVLSLLPVEDTASSYLSVYSSKLWETILSALTREQLIDEKDYLARATGVLQRTPLIDGHNDFPFVLREQLRGKIYDHDFQKEKLGTHSDFGKMKEGMMGGQFWSVFVPCPEDLVSGKDDEVPNKRVPELNEPSVRILLTIQECHRSSCLYSQ